MSRMRDVTVDRRSEARARRARVSAQGRRPGDSGIRAGDRARLHLRGRRRRPHARRRPWLPDPPLRLDGGQPRRRSRSSPRTARFAPPTATSTPTCSGRSEAAGAQSRRRHAVHVPPARGRPDGLRRADRLAVRAGRRDPRRLPDDHRRGAARAGRVDDSAQRAADAVRARGVARPQDLRDGRLLQRRSRQDRGGHWRRSGRSAIRSSNLLAGAALHPAAVVPTLR